MATVPFRQPGQQAELSSRIPPQNIEAEQGVLGSMLHLNSCIAAVRTILHGPDDFYRDVHGIVYRAICDLYDRKGAADCTLLAEELEKRDEFGVPAVKTT